jgi:hypothetical protein
MASAGLAEQRAWVMKQEADAGLQLVGRICGIVADFASLVSRRFKLL